MLLEVIAPLTSSECLCCSSTMHSEQTVVEVYIVGPWVFCCCFFCVWKILISLPHVHFVLRITLEVWKWAPFLTTRQLVKTEINIRMKMAGVCVCVSLHCPCWVACWEIFSSDLGADENWWWWTILEQSSEWEVWKCWHGKRTTYFHTKKGRPEIKPL